MGDGSRLAAGTSALAAGHVLRVCVCAAPSVVTSHRKAVFRSCHRVSAEVRSTTARYERRSQLRGAAAGERATAGGERKGRARKHKKGRRRLAGRRRLLAECSLGRRRARGAAPTSHGGGGCSHGGGGGCSPRGGLKKGSTGIRTQVARSVHRHASTMLSTLCQNLMY